MSNRCSFHKLNCPVNFPRLLASISHELVPPVGNKVIHDGHIKVMVVGGPNHRTDYHVEMGEELFHQITGHMDLFVVVDGLHKCIRIEEGQYFLLPAGIPHSPQRYPDSIGIVFERERLPGELDAMRWYTTQQPAGEQTAPVGPVWYEDYFHCTNLGTQVKQAIDHFIAYQQANPSQAMEELQACRYPEDSPQFALHKKGVSTAVGQAQSQGALLKQSIPSGGGHILLQGADFTLWSCQVSAEREREIFASLSRQALCDGSTRDWTQCFCWQVVGEGFLRCGRELVTVLKEEDVVVLNREQFDASEGEISFDLVGVVPYILCVLL